MFNLIINKVWCGSFKTRAEAMKVLDEVLKNSPGDVNMRWMILRG